MKNSLCVLLLLAILFGTSKNSGARTIKDLPEFPRESLRAGISRSLYRSIEISPVEAWVVAKAALYGSGTAHAKIIHSEANGAYDQMLLEMANSYTMTGTNGIESRVESDSLTVHLLIFKIADARMGICFAHSDDARYNGYRQTGQAWIGVLQNGRWKTVSKSSER